MDENDRQLFPNFLASGRGSRFSVQTQAHAPATVNGSRVIVPGGVGSSARESGRYAPMPEAVLCRRFPTTASSRPTIPLAEPEPFAECSTDGTRATVSPRPASAQEGSSAPRRLTERTAAFEEIRHGQLGTTLLVLLTITEVRLAGIVACELDDRRLFDWRTGPRLLTQGEAGA
jgi:hypothetical protein